MPSSDVRPGCPYTGKSCTQGCTSICTRAVREAGLGVRMAAASAARESHGPAATKPTGGLTPLNRGSR
jgi:hypothetical protein